MKNFKKLFPIFKKKIVFLNNAATTFKPTSVCEAIKKNYNRYKSSTKKDQDFFIESTKRNCASLIKKIINCNSADVNVYFVSGGTSVCFNLLSRGFKKFYEIEKIFISDAEHHANILPWMHYFKNINFIPFNKEAGKIHLDKIDFSKQSVFSLSAYSNVLGPIWDQNWQDLTTVCKKINLNQGITILDASQAILEKGFSWNKIQPDIMCFSSHKLYGPTNTGIIIAKNQFDKLIQKSLSVNLSPKLELLELKASLKFVKKYNLKKLSYSSLVIELKRFLKTIDSIELLESALDKNNQSKIITFYSTKYHAHDIASLLAEENVIVRAGNHCAKLLHDQLKISASIRISLSAYSNYHDIKLFKEAFLKVIKFLSRT